ncbi:hypothetical protein KM043_010070 [Ampulex compressa]|nr:hypothetical protein KM043_010070 [Ampulex compressa]
MAIIPEESPAKLDNLAASGWSYRERVCSQLGCLDSGGGSQLLRLDSFGLLDEARKIPDFPSILVPLKTDFRVRGFSSF